MKVGFILFSFDLRIEGFLIGGVQIKEGFWGLSYLVLFIFPSINNSTY